ncbi:MULTISPECIES: glycosyltransferase family 9 protein [unclassified Bradyrhizobium]|uniref:glycosyltransferase family 9 protein n=1 Tax=unclassified Bradyrhizobium TaxID=2631580 RepID=UPI0028F0588C|nr:MULTISPECIES: glycosyltransferase family 9 protein [unclassified Bradyrhizobium]
MRLKSTDASYNKQVSLDRGMSRACCLTGGGMGNERIAILLNCEGMGDCLFAIPVLKKIQTLKKEAVFDIFTHHPGLFANCPYVENAYPIRLVDELPGETKLLNLFKLSELPHWGMDTFNFISVPIGLGELSFREKQLEYFAVEPDRADAFDVVLNTSRTWPSRSWSLDNWQRLADVLIGQGFTVAVVGKDIVSHADEMEKRSFALAGCHDLVNKLSLDQTYYTIRKAGLFVSCQNGLSVLSGATDTELVILDMSIEWSKRAIYREANPFHKITYVKGECLQYCGSGGACPRSAETFTCVPTFERVAGIVNERMRARSRANKIRGQ